jgi:hypothetical protein
MDVITDLTCKDGTAHQLVDGWEPTHHRSVAGSRPASPTEQHKLFPLVGSQSEQ